MSATTWRSGWLVLAFIVLLGAALLTVPTHAQGAVAVAVADSFDASTNQAEPVIQDWISTHPELATTLSSSSSGVLSLKVVASAVDDPSYKAMRASLANSSAGATGAGGTTLVKVETVNRSLAQLLTIRDGLSLAQPFAKHFDSVLDWGPAAVDDVVEVTVPEITKEMQADAVATYGSSVRLVVGSASTGTGTRLDDSTPWFGGIRINRAGGSFCSAGFPMIRGSSRYLSSAGHCGPIGTVHTNNGTTVGSTAFTSYSTNGIDTQLISAASVGVRIYTGCPSCTNNLPVKGSRVPTAGNFICFSGSVTGEECGVTVGESNRCVNFTNILDTCGLTRGTKFDPLRIISQGGDSGGPVYSFQSNGVAAIGSIIGACGTGCGWYLPIGRTTSAFGATLATG